MKRKLVYLMLADPSRAPHSDLILWLLEQCGWAITCLSPSGANSLARDVLGGQWSTERISAQGIPQSVLLFKAIIASRFADPSVVCVHSQGLAYRAAPLLLGPLPGKRVVYFNPDYYDPIRYPVRSFLEGLLARRCHLHINHEYHRGYVARAQHRMRCPVLIVPPNLPAAWPIPSQSETIRGELAGRAGHEAFILRLHGSFHPLRMTGILLRALALLPERFRLVMTAPSDPLAPEKSLIRELGLAERVVLLPHMSYNDMLRYSVNADAGVLFYRNNDLGNFFQSPGRLTEYLACGLPVVSSNFTGLENLVLRFGIGRCVDSASPSSVADGILALESSVRSGELTRNSVRQTFERHFALEHWLPRVAEAFDALLEGSPSLGQSAPPTQWWPEGSDPELPSDGKTIGSVEVSR